VISVIVRVDPDRRLVGLQMSGHASVAAGASGENIVCAAATAIVRSCSEAMAAQDGVSVEGGGVEGTLYVRVSEYAARQAEWLRGVTSVLISGLERIERDSPAEVAVRVETEGEQDGP
jgi:uncharacterized protein YsxB (DUF464 family)